MSCLISVLLAAVSHAIRMLQDTSNAVARTYIDTDTYARQAKVTSLVDIWRRGNTFPTKIAELESICKQPVASRKSILRLVVPFSSFVVDCVVRRSFLYATG